MKQNNQPITTEHRLLSAENISDAQRHLSQVDENMARFIKQYRPFPLDDNDPFKTLTSTVISQLLSVDAARAIQNRVLELVPSFCPTGFLAVSHEALRATGLSERKAKYIIEIATRVQDGRLDFDALQHLSDADVTAKLKELPGIGEWTTEMFLIFTLKRPDVLSLKDVGLQNASKQLYGDTLENIGHIWKPYRSVACWYLWRYSEAEKAHRREKQENKLNAG